MSDASKIISVAKGEVGTKEKKVNGHWVNDSKFNRWFGKIPGYGQDGYGWPWCAAFVAWCADKAGLAKLYPKTASCAVGVSWFRARGRFNYYPAVGAQVFFGSGGGSHTGIVYAYDETYIYTVEGNTNDSGSAEGDGVYLKKRARRDAYTYGYGYPEFAEGIVTADPSKKGKAGYTYKATAADPTKKAAAKPVVDLSNLIAAAKRDPKLPQGGTTHPKDVKPVETALRKEGLLDAKYASDGSFGSLTVKAYAAWQRKLGYTGKDADGIPGKASLTKLGAKHGFTVKA